LGHPGELIAALVSINLQTIAQR